MNTGGLQDIYDMSQTDVGEKLFLTQQSIARIERDAIENLKKAFKDRNINIKDLLP